jgi:predicted permease
VDVVAPQYFKTLEIPMLRGRDFTPVDRDNAPKVTIVNQAMARYYFGNTNPIGRRFSIPGWLGDPRPMEIVGVVGDVTYHDLREQVTPMAYVPFLQSDEPRSTFAVRTSTSPDIMANTLRQAVARIDSRLPLFDVQTLSDQVDKSLVEERLVASLSSVFGILAAILACVGLYGLMAYAVNRRINEIGIRMALGAQRFQVARMVLRETFLLVAMGLVIGIPAAVAASRLISAELYGLKAGDPATIVLSGVVLAAVAVLAGYIPARRASRVDPMTALRYE